MKLNNYYQNLISGAIILVVIVIALACYPAAKVNVHGIYLPQTNQTYPETSPEAINIMKNVPLNGEYIGIINTSLHYDTKNENTITEGKQQSLTYAKKLAAEHGGDTMIVGYNVSPGHTGPLDSVALRAYVFRSR